MHVYRCAAAVDMCTDLEVRRTACMCRVGSAMGDEDHRWYSPQLGGTLVAGLKNSRQYFEHVRGLWGPMHGHWDRLGRSAPSSGAWLPYGGVRTPRLKVVSANMHALAWRPDVYRCTACVRVHCTLYVHAHRRVRVCLSVCVYVCCVGSWEATSTAVDCGVLV